ncbi:MAG: MFS transporter [Anaerolineales bacterium]|nr:MFS transporter [Anaerolineales bacterium]
MLSLKRWINVHFPALASRDYLLFVSGQFVSVLGTWMQATALPYLAYRLSGRPLDLGLIGFSTTLPTLLFALPAGVFVERMDKRKVVIVMQAVMSTEAFGLTYLWFTNQLAIWHILVLAFIYGSAVSVEVTARQAMLIELVGKESLPSAIALQTTAFNLGRVLGPLIAAWLIAASGGEGAVFLANGLSYIFVIGGLIMARTRFKEEQIAQVSHNVVAEFKEGLKYIRSSALVFAAILMSSLLGFFGIPLTQQIPAIARDILQPILASETAIAVRTSNLYMAQGVGALIAAFMMAYYALGDRKSTLLWGQIAFVISIIALGLTVNQSAAFFLFILIGWGTIVQLISMNTTIQVRVPNDLRGRVFSVYFWGLQGVAPFGSLLVGWVAQTWGVPSVLLLGGGACLIGFAAAHIALPHKSEEAELAAY